MRLLALGLVAFALMLVATASAETEQDFVELVNEYRAENGLEPVTETVTLSLATEWHVADMVENDYVSHTDSLSRDPFERMCDFGYCYSAYKGEIVAFWYSDAASVLEAWKNSPSHNAVLLGEHYRVIGVAEEDKRWSVDWGSHDPNQPLLPPDSSGLHGDIDCNGSIDLRDVLKLMIAYGGLEIIQEEGCPEVGT